MNGDKTPSTMVIMKRHYVVFPGMEFESLAELNGKIPPYMLVFIRNSCPHNAFEKMTIIENKKGEEIIISPGGGENEKILIPQSISLCGYYLPPDVAQKIKPFNLEMFPHETIRG